MRTWVVVSAIALGTIALDARANLPGPHDYLVVEDPPGKVSVYVLSPRTPLCPETGMLRRDVASGEVVRITTCDDGVFTDECVPAGTYAYGLAEPYACDEGPEARYYREITAAGVPEVCVPLGDPPLPADGVPWEGHGPLICSDPSGSGGCGTSGGKVLGMNLALLVAGLAVWRRQAGRRRRA